MDASVVGLLCRTSDRTPGGARGAAELAELLGARLKTAARMIGSPGTPDVRSWDEDLRDGRGCLLEAGGQVEDALAAGRLPVLCAAECSISLTTLPTVARLVPGVQFVWLDAHGDFNTPRTTRSTYLGGMCLAGACDRWPTGFATGVDPADVILVGTRDLDGPELAELDFAGVRRLERFSDVVDAVDGSDIYVHLDLDVLDPAHFPAQFPAPGGPTVEGLRHLLDEISQAAQRIVGVEITCFEAPEDPARRAELADVAADVAMALLQSARPGS